MTSIDSRTSLIVTDQDSSDLYHWQRCIEDFLSTKKFHSGSDATVAVYSCNLRLFFEMFHDKHPSTVTKQDVLEFMHRPSRARVNRGKPVTVNTINQRLTTIRSFYNWAMEYSIPGSNGFPARLFQGTNPGQGIPYGKPPKVYKYMLLDEVEQFFAAIPRDTVKGLRDYALYLTYLLTAKRRAEISRLSFGDLEPKTFNRRNGQTVQSYLYRYMPKGHQGEWHYAEMPPVAMAAILDYLKRSGRLETMTSESPIFSSLGYGYEGKALHKDYVSSNMKSYLKLAGLPPRFSVHSFRHTSARQRREAGQDILEISGVLGHVSLNTTKHYLDLLTTTGDEGADALAEQFSFTSSTKGGTQA